MRLRQIALASRGLDRVAAELLDAFGLKIAWRDPAIIHYGLRNAVLPAGGEFIEIVEPVRADASAGRFLDRRGGDAGYMLILQVADAWAERDRIAALGVRVVDQIDRARYRAAHFHPADFGGVLVSVDEQRGAGSFLERMGDWQPAGPDWRAAVTDRVEGLTGVVLTASEPAALARRWAELIGRPLDPGDPLRLPLDLGEIRFEAGDGVAIARIELAAKTPAAEAAIGGVIFSPGR